ncbi:hypothetical protein PENTCL1PPCAC_21018, partial [Pristionchus entomophagus]
GGIPNVKLELIGMSLMVKAVNVISSANLALEKTLLSTTAKYPYTRTRIKCLSVPGGRSDLPFSTIFTDIIPRRIVVGCVEQDAFDGSVSKSPFNFKPFGISEVSIDAGGTVYPAQPFSADFSSNKYAKHFLMFYENIGAVGEHRQLSIGYKKFKNGYALFAFNLSPTDSNTDFELIRSGTTQIHMKFGERTPSIGLQIVIYAEYDGMYQIDHFRNIHADHETRTEEEKPSSFHWVPLEYYALLVLGIDIHARLLPHQINLLNSTFACRRLCEPRIEKGSNGHTRVTVKLDVRRGEGLVSGVDYLYAKHHVTLRCDHTPLVIVPSSGERFALQCLDVCVEI